MNKVKTWLWQKRDTIGYSIGAANVASGVVNIAVGNIVAGLFWVAIGAFIIYDVRTYR